MTYEYCFCYGHAIKIFFQPQLSSLNETSKTFKLYDTSSNHSLSMHIMLVDKLNDTAIMSIFAVFHTLNLYSKEAYLRRDILTLKVPTITTICFVVC